MGVEIIPNPADPDYLIRVDRELVSVEFKYIRVSSTYFNTSDRDIERIIFEGSSRGTGLQTYDDLIGFRSRHVGDDYLVILYDDAFRCVGYQYFEGSEFKTN